MSNTMIVIRQERKAVVRQKRFMMAYSIMWLIASVPFTLMAIVSIGWNGLLFAAFCGMAVWVFFRLSCAYNRVLKEGIEEYDV